jgi:hypothetical protein
VLVGALVPGEVVADPGTVVDEPVLVLGDVVLGDVVLGDVAPVTSVYRTQRITWLICLSPFFPPLSMTPFLLESGQTTEPAEGAVKIVFTWKFGSVDVSDPAFTLTKL